MFSAASKTDNVSSAANYIEDVFSTYLYTGNNSLQIINNGIQIGDGQVGTGGSVYMDGVNSRINAPNTDLFNLGGSWCIEAFIYPMYASTASIHGRWYNPTYYASYIFWFDGSYIRGGAYPNYNSAGGPVELNKWSHVAMTFDGSTKRFFVNGSLVASYNQDNSITSNPGLLPSIGSNAGGGANFPGYISNLRVVSGSAVYTSSFTVPSSALTAISGTVLLCLQGSSPLTDNSGNGLTLTTFSTVTPSTNGPFGKANVVGSGGLVWIKARTNASGAIGAQHLLTDTARGASQQLFSNLTDAQTSLSAIGSFNSSGFTVSSYADSNYTTVPFASWTFKKQPKFFDVVTYTGNGVNGRTISHSLGSTPGCIIVKRTDTTSNWAVYHRSASDNLCLNSTAIEGGVFSFAIYSPTSTGFSVSSNAGVNANGGTYVAYIFAHDAGGFGASGADNVITCGSYTGNGTSTGPTINLGYEPQWILIKRATGGTDNWYVFDNMRGIPTDGADAYLMPNLSSVENTGTFVDLTATGFSITSSVINASDTYIYIAIRRGPMKTPTSGTSVFSPTTRTGTNSAATVTGVGFAPDLFLTSDRNAAAHGGISGSVGVFVDKLRGGNKYLISQNAGAEGSGVNISFQNTGISYGGSDLNTSSYDYANWFFVRAPSFMDEVCYTGTGSPQNINHNLTVAPEMIITKIRNFGTYAWRVYHSALGNGKALYLNLDYAVATATGFWNDTNPTASVFTVGSDSGTNAGGYNMVAYLFASCPGVSKVGSYTGTGATLTVSCGFAARWVMIKRTDSTGDWWVWDTARGMIAGTDPRLAMNSSAAEVNANWVYTDASGFQIVTTDATVNASGGSYIFLAVA